MCAYILKTDLIGGHARGVARTADEVVASFSLEGATRRCASAKAVQRQAKPLGGTPKRVLDLVGASIALIVLAPIMLMVATLVRLLLGGPVLFAQWRVGFVARCSYATSFAPGGGC